MKKQEETDLFSEFEPISRRKWEEQIKKDLNGDNYKETLKWDTLEGIELLPFYHEDDVDKLALPAHDLLSGLHRHSWRRCEPITGSTAAEANRQIKEGVKGGADAVQIRCDIRYSDGALGGNMIGTQIQSQNDFSRLFDGIDLSDLKLIFNSGMNTPAVLAMLKNEDRKNRSASFLFDPFTYCAFHGREPLPENKLNQIIGHLATENEFKSLAADGLFYHHSGATIIQELGIALSIASEYLARSSKESAQQTAESIFFRLSTGALYFPEMAKFRAASLLWSNLLDAYGVDPLIPIQIHAETSSQNKTVTDPYNNMLRATTEAMSAVLGGVDSLLIRPFDNTYANSGPFSKRIARNVHHILKEESYLAKVADPSAGSYYIEVLTDRISKKSWEFFQLIEKQGGFLKALKGRIIQSEIGESKKRKLEAYASRKRILVGTNHYPNSEEVLPDRVISTEYTDALRTAGNNPAINFGRLIPSLSEALKNKATVGDIFSAYLDPQKVLYTSLEPFRPGQIFESIRRKTDEYSNSTGARPVTQLVPVGDLKWRNLRSTFAQNLLGCAGFEVRNPLGYETIEDAMEEHAGQTAEVYVLCSSDEEYPGLVEKFCSAFSERGLLILAGRPGDAEQSYRDFGVDLFIYSGIDIPDTLRTIQKLIFKEENAS